MPIPDSEDKKLSLTLTIEALNYELARANKGNKSKQMNLRSFNSPTMNYILYKISLNNYCVLGQILLKLYGMLLMMMHKSIILNKKVKFLSD